MWIHTGEKHHCLIPRRCLKKVTQGFQRGRDTNLSPSRVESSLVSSAPGKAPKDLLTMSALVCAAASVAATLWVVLGSCLGGNQPVSDARGTISPRLRAGAVQLSAWQPLLPALKAVLSPAGSMTWSSGEAWLPAPPTHIVLLSLPHCLSAHLQASPFPFSTLSQMPCLPLCWHMEPAAFSLAHVRPGKGSAHFPSTAQLPARLCKLHRQDLLSCSISHNQLPARSWLSPR